MDTKFMVEPIDGRMRYYDKLSEIKSDFIQSELEGAVIGVLYGAVIVGYLDIGKVLYEVYS
jgi:hypothetical protein